MQLTRECENLRHRQSGRRDHAPPSGMNKESIREKIKFQPRRRIISRAPKSSETSSKLYCTSVRLANTHKTKTIACFRRVERLDARAGAENARQSRSNVSESDGRYAEGISCGKVGVAAFVCARTIRFGRGHLVYSVDCTRAAASFWEVFNQIAQHAADYRTSTRFIGTVRVGTNQ